MMKGLIGFLITALAPAILAAGTRDLLKKPDPWYGTDEAKAMASNILSYQSDYGGWPKDIDLAAVPFAGQPVDLADKFKPALNNGATTDEVRFMARMFAVTQDARYRRAVENGLDYIFIAQYPAGGWPQAYPPDRRSNQNGASSPEILTLLQEITTSKEFGFLDPERQSAVRAAMQRGNDYDRQLKAKLAKAAPNDTAAPWHPKVRIALAGDSTVTDPAGWGYGFKKTLAADTLCENFAAGGQSTKSFRSSGQWQKVLAAKPDYVLIQFGHNDMPGKGPHRETDPATTYAENLTRFVAEAREVGAKPILVTSLVRRIFEKEGKLRGELAPYAEAARKVAAGQHVPLIDLYARSLELVEKLGPGGVEPFNPKISSKAGAADIDTPSPSVTPRSDGTHLTAHGSIVFGKVIAEELRRVLPEMADFLRKAPSL